MRVALGRRRGRRRVARALRLVVGRSVRRARHGAVPRAFKGAKPSRRRAAGTVARTAMATESARRQYYWHLARHLLLVQSATNASGVEGVQPSFLSVGCAASVVRGGHERLLRLGDVDQDSTACRDHVRREPGVAGFLRGPASKSAARDVTVAARRRAMPDPPRPEVIRLNVREGTGGELKLRRAAIREVVSSGLRVGGRRARHRERCPWKETNEETHRNVLSNDEAIRNRVARDEECDVSREKCRLPPLTATQ